MIVKSFWYARCFIFSLVDYYNWSKNVQQIYVREICTTVKFQKGRCDTI